MRRLRYCLGVCLIPIVWLLFIYLMIFAMPISTLFDAVLDWQVRFTKDDKGERIGEASRL